MTEPSTDRTARSSRPRRPSAADVFGDVLPEVTADERHPEPDEPDADAWYRDNRPPHHDRD